MRLPVLWPPGKAAARRPPRRVAGLGLRQPSQNALQGVEIDIEDPGHFREELVAVKASGLEQLDRPIDLGRIGQAPLGAVIDLETHALPSTGRPRPPASLRLRTRPQTGQGIRSLVKHASWR